ncbi:MAG: tetratricopeptide repeat protein [Saprospiraceae bacterium]|nr:tetratricopeptide repeat protein [Saprospiraceae bacterium]
MAQTVRKNKGKRPASPPSTEGRWYPWIALALTAIVFANSLSNGFVNWDDDVNVLENPNLEVFNWTSIKGIFTSDVIGNYNPLTILTFAFEKAMFGLDPTIYHVNNLLLHLVCVWLVYRIFLALGLPALAAFFGALVFGIHPMRVESVAWVTERKDVLFGAFFLGALLLYIRYLEGGRKSGRLVLWILLLFLMSLLSKIQAVTLPLSMLCVDYLRRRPLKLGLVIEKWPYFLMSLAVGLLGIYMLRENESLDDTTKYTFIERLMVGFTSYVVYLVKFVVPYKMSPLYPYEAKMPVIFYASPAGLAAVAAVVWTWWKKDLRPYVFGMAFFTFNVMFLLQILAAGQGFLADRFTYIPYLGLIFMLAWWLNEWVQRPRYASLVRLLAVAWLCAMAFLTVRQNRIWESGGTLWTHVLKYYENVHTPWNNRARFYRESGQTDLALADYNESIRLKPLASTYNSRGKLFFDQGKIKEALNDYSEGIKLDPDLGEIYINRAAAYGMLGDLDRALADVSKGLELDPDNANGFLNRSLIYVNRGEYAKAEADHTSYLALKPFHADIYYERGLVRNALGKPQEAYDDLSQAIRLNPGQALYYNERAKSLEALGRGAEAQQDRQQAQVLGKK